jgi:hypothetical protein
VDLPTRRAFPKAKGRRCITVIYGIIGGIIFGGSASLPHLILRGFLIYNGFAWRYIRFLDEATERLFLRRAGGGYIFVHRLLLDYFADLDTTRPQAETEQPAALTG